jgi:hypothetical protein
MEGEHIVNKHPFRNASARSSICKAGLVLANVLVLGLGSLNANAQVTTNDPGAIAKLVSQIEKQVQQYEKQVQQYEKQIQQYELQLQQYQQMLINIKNLGNQVPSINNNLQHLDANAIASAQCGSAGGSSWFGSLVTSVFAPTSPYAKSQQQICQQIVAIQVQKYNETADMLNRMNSYAALANQTERDRDSIGDTGNGDLSSNSNQVDRNSAELGLEMSNWQARMKAYDAEIGALQDTQSILANAAMYARTPDLLGTSVQAAALKAALTVNQ